MTISDELYAALDADMAGDPCWRYFRDLATPGHRAILECKERLIGVTASQRCLGGETLIYDPIANTTKRVDEIDGPFHVYAYENGQRHIAKAGKPFIKGEKETIYRVELSNGQWFTASAGHLVATPYGWQSIADVQGACFLSRPSSTSGISPLARVLNAQHLNQTAPDYQFDYHPAFHSDDEQPRRASNSDQGASPSPADAPAHISHPANRKHSDALGCKLEYSHSYPQPARPSSLGDARRVGSRHGRTNRESQVHEDGGESRPYLFPDALRLREASRLTFAISLSDQSASASGACDDSHLAAATLCQPIGIPVLPILHNAQRRHWQLEPFCLDSDCRAWSESLAESHGLRGVACGPFDDVVQIVAIYVLRSDCKWDFEVPHYHNYECAGAIHHNSGKTTVLRASAAAYFRGIHPFRIRTKPVQILVVAPSMMQLATIYKKGFFNASLLHVTEEQKKVWPDLAEVVKRPLIPETELAKNSKGKPDIAWGVSKFGRVPGLIRHVDGSEMYFHISGDDNSWKRIEGMDFHAIFRDEADGNENIGNTFITRLMEHWDKPDFPDAGFYVWGASELQVVTERIEFLKKCQERQKHYAFFRLDNSDNPKVTQQNRQDAADMLGKEEADKRVWGTTTAISGQLVYGRHFSRARHVLPEVYEPSPQANLWIGWDPGTAHPFGLVCAAIEPERPSQLRVVRCYSETRKTLDYQANCIAEWLDGRFLEGLVFDSAGATKAGYARGESWFVQLEECMTQLGIKIQRGMLPGKNLYSVGIPLMWRYMDPDPTNNKADPLLLINPPGPKSPGCEQLIEELLAYRFKKSIESGAGLKGEAIHRLNDNLADPTRYLVTRQPRWVQRPPNIKRHEAFAVSSIPFPRKGLTDPLADDPTLTEEQRNYRAQLRASRAMVAEHTRSPRQRFREVRVPGW